MPPFPQEQAEEIRNAIADWLRDLHEDICAAEDRRFDDRRSEGPTLAKLTLKTLCNHLNKEFGQDFWEHGQRIVDLFDEAVENISCYPDDKTDGADEWIEGPASTLFAEISEIELRAAKKISDLEEENRRLKAKVEKLRKKYKKAKKEKQ